MFLFAEILLAEGFKRFHKEAGEPAIISIFREIGRSLEGIQAARRSKSKATRSRFRRFLVRDEYPLTKTGYVPTGPCPTFDSTVMIVEPTQKVRDKGWKVVNNGPSNRVVVRLKFRETPERFYVCSTYYSIL